MKNNNKKKRFDNELFGAYLVLLYSNLRKQIRKRKSEKKKWKDLGFMRVRERNARLYYHPCKRLWRLMVYSLVTTSSFLTLLVFSTILEKALVRSFPKP